MSRLAKKYWFKSKNFGWGWYPASWQGWALMMGYIVLTIWIVYRVDASAGAATMPLNFMIPFLMLTAGFIWICLLKGEPPRWRWGR